MSGASDRQDSRLTEDAEEYQAFEDMGLHADLLTGVLASGFKRPSACARKVIVPYSQGKNVILHAENETGRTVAFCIALLNRLNLCAKRQCQAIILVPAGFMAAKFQRRLLELGRYLQVQCQICLGDGDLEAETRALRQGAHVAIGTPGRIHYLLRSGRLRPQHVRQLLLHKADPLLSLPYHHKHINPILNLLPEQVQVAAYLAEDSAEFATFATERLSHALHIQVENAPDEALWDQEKDWDWSNDSFESMGLGADVVAGILQSGLNEPDACCQKAIVPMVRGEDVVLQVPHDMFSTTAFSIGVLDSIDLSVGQCQALVVVPKRRMAEPIEEELLSLGKLTEVTCRTCVGNTDIQHDVAALAAGVHVVVGTPGRLLILLQRGQLRADRVHMLVLHKTENLLANEMDEGFQEILAYLPGSRQVCITARSVTPAVVTFAGEVMRSPVRVRVTALEEFPKVEPADQHGTASA